MKYLITTLCLFFTACANIPSAIEDAPENDITYSQAISTINRLNNAPIRWGGVIVEVQNEQTFSELQVLFYPLNHYGRPLLNQANSGRFIVRTNEFLDPAVYTKNLEITVAGTLNGDAEHKIGNKILRLPIVNAQVIHLWPAYDPNYGYYYDRFGGYGRFGGIGINSFYGYYGPYYPAFGWGYYRPYPYYRRR